MIIQAKRGRGGEDLRPLHAPSRASKLRIFSPSPFSGAAFSVDCFEEALDTGAVGAAAWFSSFTSQTPVILGFN